jgi:uncharacterized protein Yka (UPF0111/DUF47 family)
MFSLQKLLGREEKFFELLEKAAAEAHHSATLLVEMLRSTDRSRSLDEFAVSKSKEKRVNQEISELLCSVFITPLEREDIEAISMALYRVPKTLEKFGERFQIAPHLMVGVDFTRQASLAVQATQTVLDMVRILRGRPELEAIKDHNEKLQILENEADKEIHELLKRLYAEADQMPVAKVLLLSDLYEMLERVIDQCRDAGKAIFQVVLKNN